MKLQLNKYVWVSQWKHHKIGLGLDLLQELGKLMKSINRRSDTGSEQTADVKKHFECVSGICFRNHVFSKITSGFFGVPFERLSGASCRSSRSRSNLLTRRPATHRWSRRSPRRMMCQILPPAGTPRASKNGRESQASEQWLLNLCWLIIGDYAIQFFLGGLK